MNLEFIVINLIYAQIFLNKNLKNKKYTNFASLLRAETILQEKYICGQ